MTATKLLFILTLSLHLCSCQSRTPSVTPKPVLLSPSAHEIYYRGAFELLAEDPVINCYISSEAAVVVWCEQLSGWSKLKALAVPAGSALNEILRKEQRLAVFSVFFENVIIIKNNQRLTLDAKVAMDPTPELLKELLLPAGAVVIIENEGQEDGYYRKSEPHHPTRAR